MLKDELNIIEQYVSSLNLKPQSTDSANEKQKKELSLEVVDIVEDLLIVGYVDGVKYVNDVLGTDIKVNEKEMYSAIYKRTADKNFQDRVFKYVENGLSYDLARVMNTDLHRVYNEAVYNTSVASGRTLYKLWATELDDKVRDTHEYLEGMTARLDERFFTYDGDSALFPGDFTLAENNVNCRCVIEIIPTNQ